MRMLEESMIREIEEIRDEIVGTRRYLHQHPEVGFETQETEKLITEKLQQWDIEILPSTIGVIGKVSGKNHDKVICLRADIDALNLEEENDVPYKSIYPGKMHACGHDGHTAILLGAAKIISIHRNELPLDVIFVFQPAEEGPDEGGAVVMAQDLKKMGVTEKTVGMFGMHVGNLIPLGVVATKQGSLTASTDDFDVTIIGAGGHAGMPQFSVDATSLGAQFVTAMESFMSRQLDPLDAAVCSIGTFRSGLSRNVIAEKVEISGTIRCLAEKTRGFIIKNLEQILKGICDSRGATYELKVRHGLPVLYNDEKATAYAIDAVRNVLGEQGVFCVPNGGMGAEDFAQYSKVMPVSFLLLGTGNKEKGFTAIQHKPDFDFDEDAMTIGVKIFCMLVFGYEADKN